MKNFYLALFAEGKFTNKETNETIEYSKVHLVQEKDGVKSLLSLKTNHKELNKEDLRTMKMGTQVTFQSDIATDGTVKISHVEKA